MSLAHRDFCARTKCLAFRFVSPVYPRVFVSVANCLAQVICISAAVFYAGAISPALVIRKTLRLGASRTSCPLDKHSAPPMPEETSQAAFDALAFQVLALRRKLF